VDIFRRVSEAVKEARHDGDSNDVDGAARFFSKIPGLFLKFVVWLLTKLDYFGKMPRIIESLSPFHGSLFISDLGSINLPPVMHHLYDFGNIPLFLAFGPKSQETILDKTGNPVERRFLRFGLTLDERITDGFYFSGCWRIFREVFATPELLDSPPEKVVEDVP